MENATVKAAQRRVLHSAKMVHLRVLTSQFMPMITECGQYHFDASLKHCTYPGWMSESFDYLMHSLGWTYEVVVVGLLDSD